MKRFAFLLTVWSFRLFAVNDVLPEDEFVKIGKLPNGLTYYIRENGFPKGRASLRLVVKAGSFHEREDQRGLAHFLEHMLFRGSKHFQDWEMINYLESIGAKFGPDTNAHTLFDLTCYMLEIPLNKEEVLDKGILILSDWAGRANLDNTMIDKERDVIMDEYNILMKNPVARVVQKYFDHFFHGSLYTERLPVGKKEVIRSCDPELIREFYRTWYRPDRMAVVVVGDFDADVVESYIREHFYDLEAATESVTEPDLHYTAPEKSYFIVEEPEFFENIGGLVFVEEVKESKPVTKKGVANNLIAQIFDSTLHKRLNRASKKNPSPYLQAFTSSSDISSYHRIEELLFYCFEDRPLDGLKAFYEEISVLKEFGPTDEEWKSAVQEIQEGLRQSKANLDRVEHDTFVTHYINHFMQNIRNISYSDLLNAKEELLPQLTPADVIDWAEVNVDMTQYHAVFITPKKDLIESNKIKECLNALEGQTWVKPVRGEVQKFEVTATSKTPCKFQFLYHPTNLEKKEVRVKLIAKGGSAAFPEESYSSLMLAPNYLLESGLANLDGTSLQETLQAKNLSFHIAIGGNSRSITISGNPEHEEFIFQLIRSIFLEKRFNQDAWSNLVEQVKELERNRDNYPKFVFSKKVEEIVHSNHPFFTLLSAKDAKEELAKEVMEKAFGNPEEFTMIVVGDFDQEKWKGLAERYLNFDASAKMDPTVLPMGTFPKEGREETLHLGKDGHCYNVIAYQGSFSIDENRKTTYSYEALEHLIQHRLLEKLRHDFGDTYAVRTSSAFPFAPNLEEVFFYIYFTTEPEKSEKLKDAALAVINELVKEGPTDDEIAKEREILLTAKRKEMQSNSEWLSLLSLRVYQGTSMADLTDETLIEKEVTKESIQHLASELFSGKAVKVTLLPE